VTQILSTFLNNNQTHNYLEVWTVAIHSGGYQTDMEADPQVVTALPISMPGPATLLNERVVPGRNTSGGGNVRRLDLLLCGVSAASRVPDGPTHTGMPCD